jgi:hypothetical protein
MYAKGRGVPKDDTEAVKWYRLAAGQGNAKAQSNLGVMYDLGRGVPQDYAEAVKWYRFAAGQGNAKAQYNLGLMYKRGRGVPKDYAEAHKWFNLAASRGHKEAVKNRGIVSRLMSRDQIAEAQRLAREWKPKPWSVLKKTLDRRYRPGKGKLFVF